MKEQNNIEGTVDKTSLKCKGILFFFRFSSSLNVTTVAPQQSNHLLPFTPETFHQFLSSSPHHGQISLPPSIKQTNLILI